ncbi:hypothetical protein Acr_21g0006600 [Actinidia rufa]|uniref:Uncharacterized protein n=1 Tax=Actinidia rufa TaxID=165716 RepID=A0A7J0GH60_9ERIC|nr:hypothetical protein Acr_21g0006600 [Actinidia rufa]
MPRNESKPEKKTPIQREGMFGRSGGERTQRILASRIKFITVMFNVDSDCLMTEIGYALGLNSVRTRMILYVARSG